MGERQCALLAIDDPGRLWLPRLGEWNPKRTGHRWSLFDLGATYSGEAATRRQRQDDRVREHDIRSVEVLDDVPNVSLHFRSLVPDEQTSIISRNPRDVRDLHQFGGGEAEEIERMPSLLLDLDGAALDNHGWLHAVPPTLWKSSRKRFCSHAKPLDRSSRIPALYEVTRRSLMKRSTASSVIRVRSSLAGGAYWPATRECRFRKTDTSKPRSPAPLSTSAATRA